MMTGSSSDAREPMTCDSSPLRIATVETPRGGRIGMTLCPGKIGPGRRHPWVRSLERDLDAIEAWGASCLLTLMEYHELIDYQVGDLGDRARARFGRHGWFHLPIVDGSLPEEPLEVFWTHMAPVFHQYLADGGGIVVHCLGGLGRTGLVACRLLVEQGLEPQEALQEVRQARPGAVETPQQEAYVLGLQSSLSAVRGRGTTP